MLSFAVVPKGTLRIQSSNLGIGGGNEIRIDGKTIGIATCEIALRTNARHKVELKAQNGAVQTYFLTVKTLKKSELVDNIPPWFLNPTLLQPDFPNYEGLTSITAISESIPVAINKAEAEGKAKLAKSVMNRSSALKEVDGKGKLGSSKSRYYPKLTRGKMDSLNDVNGGKMVAQSLSEASEVMLLEFEIQKIGNEYRVYVLAGREEK